MTRRLLVTYLTITCLTLAALVIPLGRESAAHARDVLLRDIERDAVVVASLVEEHVEDGTVPSGIGTVLREYSQHPGGRIVVVDKRGRAVVDSASAAGAAAEDFSTRPEIARALAGHRAEGTRHSNTLHADLVYVAVPIASEGTVRGAVRITYPSSELDARIRSTWWRLIALSLVVLAIVVVVGFALARSVTRPVRRLRTASRALAAGDLGARARADEGPPEIRDLAATFNDTADRLGVLLEAQRAFVADASHQLRTPLAVVRLRLENLADELPSGGPHARVEAIRAEVSRLNRIVDGLLQLARADAASPPMKTVDLGAVVRSRAELWSTLAHEQHVGLSVTAPDGVVSVRAEEGGPEQVLDNLLANALEVAPAHTSVRLVLERNGDRVCVHVIDAGPGLSADQRTKAFDRFWRAADAAPGGSGLGLAVVRQLMRRVQGDAELRAAPGGGLDAVVTFVAT